jgi:hypothetical protein
MGDIKMKSVKSVPLFLSLWIVFLLGFGVAGAQEKAKESKEKEAAGKILDTRKLPPAVQKTVQEQTKGATIVGLAKEVENGKTQYELETKINGHNRDLIIDTTGKVTEVEEEVDIATLPAAIQAEVKKSLGTAKVLLFESVTQNGTLTGYEAAVEKGGKKSSVSMGPDGKVPAKAKK